MAVEVGSFRSFFAKLNIIAIILAIIILVLSAISSPKAQGMFIAFAIIMLVITAIGQLRVSRSKDLKQAGERAVQTVWIWTSFGFVPLTMSPTPYFDFTLPVMTAMMVIGAILLLLGAFLLIRIKKLTGVYLSI
jgi:hypothetical protein